MAIHIINGMMCENTTMANYIFLRKTDAGYEIRACEGLVYPSDVRNLAVAACVDSEWALDYLRGTISKRIKLTEQLSPSREQELIYLFNEEVCTYRTTIEPAFAKANHLSLQRSIKSYLQEVVEQLKKPVKPIIYKPIQLFHVTEGFGLSTKTTPHAIVIEYFPEDLLAMAFEYVTVELKQRHQRNNNSGWFEGTIFLGKEIKDSLVKDLKEVAGEFRRKYVK